MSLKTPRFAQGAERQCCACRKPFAGGRYAENCPPCVEKRNPCKRKFFWTPERDELLHKYWKGGRRGVVTEFLRAIDWPLTAKYSVLRRAIELGLPPLTRVGGPGLEWTPEETAFLEAHAGRWTVFKIAKWLKRSPRAVAIHIFRMGVSADVRGAADGYTLEALGACLGEHQKTIARWVERGCFGRIQYRHGGKAPAFERDPRLITPVKVRAFIRDYPNLFRLDRVDQTWFLDLIFNKYADADGRDAAA